MKVLWGPVADSMAARGPMMGHDVRSFGTNESDYPFAGPAATWESLLAQPGPDFAPDAIVWCRPEYYPFPGQGPLECPVPLVALVSDWNLAYSMLEGVLRLCDYIFTDRTGVETFRRAGYDRVAYWPCFAYDPGLYRAIPGLARSYDITFVGNLNHAVQRERASWLHRLALLGRRYRVRIQGGVYGEAYARLLNQSKIVFNRSIRGELNLRAYEATACGALLFLEEDNCEVRDVFRPGQECVLYNDDNFEALVDRYLADDAARQRIAQAGHRRVQTETDRAHEERLLQTLGNLLPGLMQTSGGRQTRWQATALAERFYWRARQQAHGSTVGHLGSAEQALLEALTHDQDSPEFWSALGALRAQVAAALAPENGERAASIYEAARQALVTAIGRWPNYALAHYSLANLYAQLDQPELAIASLGQMLALLSDRVEAALPRSGSYFPRQYDTFSVEWERAAAHAAGSPGSRVAAHRLLLLWDGWRRQAALYSRQGQYQSALEAWARALGVRPDLGDPYAARAMLLERTGPITDAAADYRAAIDREPFHIEAWRGLARVLHRLGRTAELQAFCSECVAIIDSCPNYAPLRPEFAAYCGPDAAPE